MSQLKSVLILKALLSLAPVAMASNVTPIFRSDDIVSPSYIIQQKKRNVVRVNRGTRSFRFYLENGTITYATVELWRNRDRVAVTYALNGDRYKVERIYKTNLGLYYNTANPLVMGDNCNLQQPEISNINAVVSAASSPQQFIDQSCRENLNFMAANSLSALNDYLDPKPEKSGGKLLECLNSISLNPKYKNRKSEISDIRASLIALMRKQETGVSAVKVSCKVEGLGQENQTASCNPADGSITLLTANKTLKISDFNTVKENFIHELIHHSHPLGTDHFKEEDLAKGIAEYCGPKAKALNISTEVDAVSAQLTLADGSPAETKANLTQNATADIQAAVANTPVQKVPQDSLESINQVAQNTTPENANSVNAAFENVMEGPTETFSNTTTRVANALVPQAVASTPQTVTVVSAGGAGGSDQGVSSTQNATTAGNSNSRSPASSGVTSRYTGGDSKGVDSYDPKTEELAALKGGAVIAGATNLRTLASGGSNNQEKIVEEIIVPTTDGKGFTRTTIQTPNASPNQSIAALNAVAAASGPSVSPGAEVNAAANSSGQGGAGAGGSNLSDAGTTSGGRVGGRGIASTGVPSSRPIGGGGSGGGGTVQVSGISFSASNVEGASYQRYRQQINNSQFKSSLEDAGILITRSGTLLSKPRTVSATYIDNGNALVYAGF